MWIALATFIVGLVMGYENNKIRNQVSKVKDSLGTKEVGPTVTYGNPEFTHEENIGDDNSSIVIPKSPQMVEWEEQQELEKLNRTGRPR